VHLRPLAVGELLDVSLKLYRRFFGPLVRSAAVVTLPVYALQFVVQISLLPNAGTTPNLGHIGQPGFNTVSGSGISGVGALVGELVIFLLTAVSAALVTAANLKIVADGYLGHAPTWQESLRFARRRAGGVLWITFLSGLGLVVGFIAVVVPGIWLYAAWSVAVPVLLLENARGRRALGRSLRLVRHRWWPVAGVLVVSTLLRFVVAAALGAVLLALVHTVTSGATATRLVGAIAQAAGGILLAPFGAAVVAVMYFDLRVRKEGFDLQLLAADIGSAGGGSAGGGSSAGGDPGRASWPDLLPPPPLPAPPTGAGAPPFWPPPPGWAPPAGGSPAGPPGGWPGSASGGWPGSASGGWPSGPGSGS
jgi:hypothetical protein